MPSKKAAPGGFEIYWSGEYAQNDPASALGTGAQHLVGALGLILGGLGTLVSSVASNPTQPPPVAGPVGIATQLGDIFWGAGPILTLYVAASDLIPEVNQERSIRMALVVFLGVALFAATDLALDTFAVVH